MAANTELQDVAPGQLAESTAQASAVVISHTTKQLQRQSYYRSRIYTSQIGINPLVAAAHPIFSVIERINLDETSPEVLPLQDNLLHELKAFTTRARAEEYSDEVILIAHYLLCASIDEAIKKALLKNNNIVTDIQVFTPSNPNDNGPEQRFFQILDRIINKPDNYLDLIELVYLCLRTGFEGKFWQQTNSKQHIDDILENIYQVIKHYRKEINETLFVTTATPLMIIKKPFPMRILALALTTTLTLSYGLTNYLLNYKAATVMTQIASLSHHNQHHNY